MNTAIVINLNYVAIPTTLASVLVSLIEKKMLSSGFYKNGRVFLSRLTPSFASSAAKEVVEQLDIETFGGRGEIYSYILDFYSFDYNHAENLLLPTPGSILASPLFIDKRLEVFAA